MDKLSNAIIEFILEQPAPASCFCSLNEAWDGESDVSFSALTKSIGATDADALKAVDYLVRNGFAEYKTLRSSSGPVITSFCLKHEGLRYKEFRHLSNKERWKERIVGAAVTIGIWAIQEFIQWLISK